MSDKIMVVADECRPGIEILELRNEPGYEDEHLVLSNGLSNGLRFQIWEDETEEDGGTDIAHFHIKSRETALLIAARLTQWAERIANPPEVDETVPTSPSPPA